MVSQHCSVRIPEISNRCILTDQPIQQRRPGQGAVSLLSHQHIRLDPYLIQRGDQPRLRIKGATIHALMQHLHHGNVQGHTTIDQPLLCLAPGGKLLFTPERAGLEGLLTIYD